MRELLAISTVVASNPIPTLFRKKRRSRLTASMYSPISIDFGSLASTFAKIVCIISTGVPVIP